MATLPPSPFKAKAVATRLIDIIRQKYAAPHVFLLREITKTFHGYILEEHRLEKNLTTLMYRVCARWQAVVRHLGDCDLSQFVIPTLFTATTEKKLDVIGSHIADVTKYDLICIMGTLYRDTQGLLDPNQGKLPVTLNDLQEVLRRIHNTHTNSIESQASCPWLHFPIVGYGHKPQFDAETINAIRQQPHTLSPDDVIKRTRLVTNTFF